MLASFSWCETDYSHTTEKCELPAANESSAVLSLSQLHTRSTPTCRNMASFWSFRCLLRNTSSAWPWVRQNMAQVFWNLIPASPSNCNRQIKHCITRSFWFALRATGTGSYMSILYCFTSSSSNCLANILNWSNHFVQSVCLFVMLGNNVITICQSLAMVQHHNLRKYLFCGITQITVCG